MASSTEKQAEQAAHQPPQLAIHSQSSHSRRAIFPASPLPEGSSMAQAIGAVGGSRSKAVPRRSHITPVACTPCQTRKSKCDGARPICSACATKKRTDCVYDAASDQRRTSALKSRIRVLDQEVRDLKDLISGICNLPSRESTIATAEQLLSERFQSLAQAAEAIRGIGGLASPSSENLGLTAGAASSPRTSVPSDFPYDPNLLVDSPLSSAPSDSATWSTAGEGGPQWSIQLSPVEDVDNTPWPPGASSSTSQQLPIAGLYNAPGELLHSHPPSVSASDSFDYNIESSRASSLDDLGGFSGNTRSWNDTNWSERGIRLYQERPASPNQTSPTRWVSTTVPLYELEPCMETDEVPLSKMYWSFLAEQRNLIDQGWPVIDVLGPPVEDVSSLVMSTKSSISSHSHRTVCEWTADVVRHMDGLQLPERIAIFLMLVRFMRWRIAPNLETFLLLPDCMRPTPNQLLIQHPAWVDLVPWPKIRDAFIESSTWSAPGLPIFVLCSNMSVNWAGPPAEILHRDLETGNVLPTPDFSRHAQDINNWSLEPSVIEIFPMLVGRV